METLKHLAGSRYGWSPDHFVRRTFMHCISPWQRPFVLALRPFWSRIYAADLALIAKIAEMTNYNDVYQVAQDFADSRRQRNLFRDTLGMRPHGRRLLAMARDALPGRMRREGGDGGGPALG